MADLVIYIAVLCVFVMIFTVEVIAPASGNECDKRWQIYASGISALQIIVTLGAGWMFAEWFQQNAVFQLSLTVSPIAAAFIAFFVTSFLAYWWHRLTHKYNILWRVIHQLHHSPRRIESLTAFYVHPLDGLTANILNAFVAFYLLGLSVPIAAMALGMAATYNLYVHSDTRSPRWLGAIVQRPEMHRVHHQSGCHEKNYGLPIWDILFGTYCNPIDYVRKCGFSEEKERLISDMLVMRDVDG